MGNPENTKRTTKEDYDQTAVKYTKVVTGSILMASLLGLAGYFSGSDFPSSTWFRNMGAGSLIGGAFFLLGAMTGFLFGIPKEKNGSPKDAGTGVRPNTNLEQISDWLTKIIVGVGLTQLNSAPVYIKKAAAFFAPAFQGCSSQTPAPLATPQSGVPPSSVIQPCASHQSVAITLILLGLITGFLAGYLITRLYLTKAFDEGDDELELNGQPPAPEDKSAQDDFPRQPRHFDLADQAEQQHEQLPAK